MRISRQPILKKQQPSQVPTTQCGALDKPARPKADVMQRKDSTDI